MSYHILFDECEEERLGRKVLRLYKVRNRSLLF